MFRNGTGVSFDEHDVVRSDIVDEYVLEGNIAGVLTTTDRQKASRQ